MLQILVQVFANNFLASVIDLFPHVFINPAMQVQDSHNQMVSKTCALSREH